MADLHIGIKCAFKALIHIGLFISLYVFSDEKENVEEEETSRTKQ